MRLERRGALSTAQSLAELVDQRAREQPNHPALIFPDATVTFEELASGS